MGGSNHDENPGSDLSEIQQTGEIPPNEGALTKHVPSLWDSGLVADVTYVIVQPHPQQDNVTTLLSTTHRIFSGFEKMEC